jgi:hypothetical protein
LRTFAGTEEKRAGRNQYNDFEIQVIVERKSLVKSRIHRSENRSRELWPRAAKFFAAGDHKDLGNIGPWWEESLERSINLKERKTGHKRSGAF